MRQLFQRSQCTTLKLARGALQFTAVPVLSLPFFSIFASLVISDMKEVKHGSLHRPSTFARPGERTVHEKRRNNACPHCAAAFGYASEVTRHVRAVHEKCRDHACPHCAAAFGYASDVTRHVRAVHEQIKDHACPQCAAVFGYASDVTRHVRAVHEKRRDHACPHCDAAFGEGSNLASHVRTVHTKRRDHVCPHCARAFGEAGTLRKHVRTAHIAPHCAAATVVAAADYGAAPNALLGLATAAAAVPAATTNFTAVLRT